MVKTYTYIGKNFTIAQLAEFAGCTEQTMKARLRHYTAEQAVALKGKLLPMPVTYLYKGKQLTIRQLADIAGTTRNSMAQRLLMYMPDEAVEMGPCSEEIIPERFEYKGCKYTVQELAVLAGVSKTKMDEVLDKARSVEEAIKMVRVKK